MPSWRNESRASPANDMRHIDLISGLWIAWLVLWLGLAVWSKRTAQREPLWSRFAHGVPLGLAIWLYGPAKVLHERFLPHGDGWWWLGAVLVMLGLAWTVYARAVLGRNWSGTVTLKQSHELVRSGPYRWTRHPIYTGLIVALLGTAIALGEWRGLVGLLLVMAAFSYKLQVEERFMMGAFPVEYPRYRAEVPALVPGLRARR